MSQGHAENAHLTQRPQNIQIRFDGMTALHREQSTLASGCDRLSELLCGSYEGELTLGCGNSLKELSGHGQGSQNRAPRWKTRSDVERKDLGIKAAFDHSGQRDRKIVCSAEEIFALVQNTGKCIRVSINYDG
jgi:hypothetical protein